MVIHIDDPAVEFKLKELAKERGASISGVIGIAVSELGARGNMAHRPRPTIEELQLMIRS